MSYTPPPPPPPPGEGGYGHAGPPQQNSKAMWAMILGILGLVVTCAGVVLGIPAIILGSSAKKEIAASGGAQTGGGMAQAGIILGWISLAIGALFLILFASGFVAFDQSAQTGMGG